MNSAHHNCLLAGTAGHRGVAGSPPLNPWSFHTCRKKPHPVRLEGESTGRPATKPNKDFRPVSGSRRFPQHNRPGLTLLEVIIATAILAGALVTLGEVIRLASRSATETQVWTRAELLAASKLAEIAAGITPLDATNQTPFPDNPGWVYSITVAPTDEADLVAVQVTVEQKPVAGQEPMSYSLVRWMADSNLTTGESEEETETPPAAETAPPGP